MVKHMNENEFKTEILESDKLCVIDFFATWCGPCKEYAPVVEEVSEMEQYKENVIFAKVDIDENADIAIQYDVQAVPTTILFKNGEVLKTELGYREKEELQKMIDSTLI